MLVQNNTLKFTPKFNPNNTPKLQLPSMQNSIAFKSNEIASVDKLELGNISPLESGLAKLDKITKEEYNTLTEQEKEALRSYSLTLTNCDRNTIKTDVEAHYYMANAVKTMMDKQFGKGNYVIIPVGRSLSSLGKLLELQIGKDNVKNIPLSTLQRYYKSAEDGFEENIGAISNFTSKDGFKDFKEYLSSIGLDRETVENSGKNYVIMDFSHTGQSLSAARDILTCDELLGNSKRNVHAVSINQVFDLIMENVFECHRSMISKIKGDLGGSLYKTYSFVGKLDGQLTDLSKAVDYKLSAQEYHPRVCEHIIKMHKIFGFNLLDTEFSGQEKPCQHELTFVNDKKSYPNQERYFWYDSKETQLFEETRQDAKEIYKVMGLVKEPFAMLRYYIHELHEVSPEKENLMQEEFKDIHETFISLKELVNKTLKMYGRYSHASQLGEDYYSTFRPIVFETIKNLSRNFSADNNKKLLAVMEKRFRELIKNHI